MKFIILISIPLLFLSCKESSIENAEACANGANNYPTCYIDNNEDDETLTIINTLLLK